MSIQPTPSCWNPFMSSVNGYPACCPASIKALWRGWLVFPLDTRRGPLLPRYLRNEEKTQPQHKFLFRGSPVVEVCEEYEFSLSCRAFCRLLYTCMNVCSDQVMEKVLFCRTGTLHVRSSSVPAVTLRDKICSYFCSIWSVLLYHSSSSLSSQFWQHRNSCPLNPVRPIPASGTTCEMFCALPVVSFVPRGCSPVSVLILQIF